MAVLLRFGHSVGLHAMVDEKFAERIFDLRRLDKESLGEMQIAVILEHACIKHFWHISAIKAAEIVIVERH